MEEEEEEEALTPVIPKWKAMKITTLTLWAPEEPPPPDANLGADLPILEEGAGSVLCQQNSLCCGAPYIYLFQLGLVCLALGIASLIHML